MKNLAELMRRLMNRDAAVVVAALAFGGLALYVADRYLEHQETQMRAQVMRERNAGTTEVIVAKVDLLPGAEVSEQTMAVRAIPTEYLHAEALTPDKFDAVKGKRLDRKLEKGRALLVSYVADGLNGFSDTIAAGHRALTLNVDEVSSINGLVRPGDKLDLIVTTRNAGALAVSPLLYDVKVLATGQLTASSTAAEQRPGANLGLSYSTITLEVTPREAQTVILARETGQVTAMLRRRNSKDIDTLPPLGADTEPRATSIVPAHEAKRSAGREVDYILGGRGDGMPEFRRVPVDVTAWVASGGGSPRPQLPPMPQRRGRPPPALPQLASGNAAPPTGAPVMPGMAPGVPVQILPADSPYLATPEPAK